MAKVSIIVPVYKIPEGYLRRCVESMTNQTEKDLQIILIEDGSPDNCGAICDNLAAEDPRIQVIHQKNQGVSAARNTGLKAVEGEYVAFVDADDAIKENAIELALKALESNEADCAIFGWDEESEEDGQIIHTVTEVERCVKPESVRRIIAGDNLKCGGGYPWNKVWKTSVLKGGDGEMIQFPLDLNTYEDKYWILEVLFNAKKVVLMPEVLYIYNFLPTSLTKSDKLWENRIFNGLEAYERIVRLLESDTPAYEAALRFYNVFLLDKMCDAYKMRRKHLGHYQRMKQVFYENKHYISKKYLPNEKRKLKLDILLTLFRFE